MIEQKWYIAEKHLLVVMRAKMNAALTAAVAF